MIRVSVSRRQESILDPTFLKTFRQISEDVYFVKGVDRRTVRSMVSPETLVVIINEEKCMYCGNCVHDNALYIAAREALRGLVGQIEEVGRDGADGLRVVNCRGTRKASLLTISAPWISGAC
jgi:NAD-dependent dihydropyrimidine dehydrogenase PreA subunit